MNPMLSTPDLSAKLAEKILSVFEVTQHGIDHEYNPVKITFTKDCPLPTEAIASIIRQAIGPLEEQRDRLQACVLDTERECDAALAQIMGLVQKLKYLGGMVYTMKGPRPDNFTLAKFRECEKAISDAEAFLKSLAS